MRWLIKVIFAGNLIAFSSCQSMSQQARTAPEAAEEWPDYDGTADSLDSLPDCVPEMAGSSFWVREVQGAFDCSTSGKWVHREAAVKPDDGDIREPGVWTPRKIDQ